MKKIIYVHDFRFYTNENYIYTAVGMPESYFNRFFEIGVDKVSLISRNEKKNINDIKSIGFDKVTNAGLNIPIEINSYLSLLNPIVMSKIFLNLRSSDFIVINFPSLIGLFVWFINLFSKKPYSLEIAADYDQFASKRFGFLVSIIFKCLFKLVVNKSVGCIYVSNYLFLKYMHLNSTVSSNVNIDVVGDAREINEPLIKKPVSIAIAGGVNKRKGIDVAINAIKKLRDAGVDNVVLNIAGGHFDFDYQAYVSKYGLDRNVKFLGLLNKSELYFLYRNSDLYIQPSRSEGIPRATIEAMSFGLPVIATDLPGFKEILDSEFLIEVEDSTALSEKIINILTDVDLYNLASCNNIMRSKNFLYKHLHENRKSFYRSVIGF